MTGPCHSFHGFRWLPLAEINDIIIKYSADDSEDGYIFGVDLTYSESLHPRHSDYPLAPERLTIDESMLSTEISSTSKESFHQTDTQFI